MPKEIFADYQQELEFQREVWQRKPSVRALYCRWYARIVSNLAPARPVVEIGAGCGNFKAYFPETIATDALRCSDRIDGIVDACLLPFREGEVGNFVLIDCLHHLTRPLDFLRGAGRSLQLGGRIVLLEPAITPWARFTWKTFHHENIDLQQNLFAENNEPKPANAGFPFSNMAIATLLFVSGKHKLPDHLPGLSLILTEYSDFLVYPATGGFSYHNFVPASIVPTIHAMENWVMRPFASWLTGLRMLVVLEKRRR